jgi:hypothetical protein
VLKTHGACVIEGGQIKRQGTPPSLRGGWTRLKLENAISFAIGYSHNQEGEAAVKCPSCWFESPSESVFCPPCGTKIALPQPGALQWLETGIRERDTLIPFIHIYVELKAPALARDPRFGAILDRLQLPRD